MKISNTAKIKHNYTTFKKQLHLFKSTLINLFKFHIIYNAVIITAFSFYGEIERLLLRGEIDRLLR